jgi:hypothetical protein
VPTTDNQQSYHVEKEACSSKFTAAGDIGKKGAFKNVAQSGHFGLACARHEVNYELV